MCVGGGGVGVASQTQSRPKRSINSLSLNAHS